VTVATPFTDRTLDASLTENRDDFIRFTLRKVIGYGRTSTPRKSQYQDHHC
jgi:hypothetical protein